MAGVTFTGHRICDLKQILYFKGTSHNFWWARKPKIFNRKERYITYGTKRVKNKQTKQKHLKELKLRRGVESFILEVAKKSGIFDFLNSLLIYS